MRTLGAVILGYVVIVVCVMATLSLLWLLTGPGFAFRPGTLQASPGWIAGNLFFSFAAAVAGGYVCTWIGRSTRPFIILAGLVALIGLIAALMQSMAPPPPPLTVDPETLSMFEAASQTQQPLWVAFVLPLLGALGVVLGGKLRGPGPQA